MIEIFNHDRSLSVKLDAVQVNQRMAREPMIHKRPNQSIPFSRDFGNLTNMFIVSGILTGDRLQLKFDLENMVRNWWKIGTKRDRIVHLRWWSPPDTTLTSNISANDLSIAVASTNNWSSRTSFNIADKNIHNDIPYPSSGIIQIGTEKMSYTSRTIAGQTPVFTGLTRGILGTTPQAHTIGTIVRPSSKEYTGVITQCDFAELAGNVNEFDFTLEIQEVQER